MDNKILRERIDKLKIDKESKKEIVKKWREVKKAKGSDLTNSQLLQLILEVLDIKI
jgi:hypothetical protein